MLITSPSRQAVMTRHYDVIVGRLLDSSTKKPRLVPTIRPKRLEHCCRQGARHWPGECLFTGCYKREPRCRSGVAISAGNPSAIVVMFAPPNIMRRVAGFSLIVGHGTDERMVAGPGAGIGVHRGQLRLIALAAEARMSVSGLSKAARAVVVGRLLDTFARDASAVSVRQHLLKRRWLPSACALIPRWRIRCARCVGLLPAAPERDRSGVPLAVGGSPDWHTS
jgi:hypothetical protein